MSIIMNEIYIKILAERAKQDTVKNRLIGFGCGEIVIKRKRLLVL